MGMPAAIRGGPVRALSTIPPRVSASERTIPPRVSARAEKTYVAMLRPERLPASTPPRSPRQSPPHPAALSGSQHPAGTDGGTPAPEPRGAFLEVAGELLAR